MAEDSPFGAATKWDDAPLPPVLDTVTDPSAAAQASEGVCTMLDSPFASSLITPGLMEQLSQSVAASRQQVDDAAPSGEQPGAQMTQAHAAPAAAPAPAAGVASVDAAAASKVSGQQPRLQGVASILESPFASTCLSQEAHGAGKAAA